MTKNVLEASSDVLNILRSADIDDTGLTLTAQLDRAQYVAVNKFLETAGAKWNRKAKRHVFEPGAKERIDALLSTGSLVDEKKAFQAFYTPAEVAEQLVELADIEPFMRCLEPSAGDGVIAEAIKEANGSVVCVELNERAATTLDNKCLVAYNCDFLRCRPVDDEDDEPDAPALGKFDRVVMNPPFTNDQDIKHVRHAFTFLKPGGRLIAIMSPGFTFGGSRTRQAFRDFVEKHGGIVDELPEGTFKESGTNVRTVVVELKK